jgi:hypothetical protein
MKNQNINCTEDNNTGLNHAGDAVNTPLARLTALSIVGDNVTNAEDENLGTIKDLMINVRSGIIEYAVIEFGGVAGIGGKLFAFPYSEFHIDEDNRCFILDKTREELKELPGFDKDHWPYTNDHSFNVMPITNYQI